MTKLELQNHQVWRDFTEILETLDTNALAKKHLELSDYKICGYWDEQDKYYETITLPRILEAELVSSSIGVTYKERFLQLKFFLIASTVDGTQKLGELVLIYNENLEFIDENWLLDIDSLMLEIQL